MEFREVRQKEPVVFTVDDLEPLKPESIAKRAYNVLFDQTDWGFNPPKQSRFRRFLNVLLRRHV